MTCTAATNSAPSRRYSPASAAITAIKDSALLMGCVCASRLTAPAMHTTPNARKSMRCTLMNLFLPRHRNGSRDHICQGYRQQKLPSKCHQLIVTEARKRAPYPYIDKEKYEHFGDKPEYRQYRSHNLRTKKRAMPAAEKQ